MDNKIETILLQENDTIKEAMEHINEGGMGIALIVAKNRKLLGVATDGDIRRALLSGKKLNSPIKNIMATNPVTASQATPATELLEIMVEKGIQQIPIVNTRSNVVDIVLLRDLKSIPLSNPDITHKEIEIINKVLSTPFLSIGPKVKEFEKEVARYIGTKYAVAVNSGTSALHLCIRSLDIKDGDEVITTPFSFIASSNSILFERAKPVFVDIDEKTLCIDANKIEENINPKTKAILPVHIFGHPCQMDKIIAIARRYNLAVIEDACEALGTEYRGKKVGSFGEVGAFAFYPNKQITTGEGGMIVTDSEEIASSCESMRNQGRDKDDSWLCHRRLGYNYRMSELSAALGVAQMDRIEEILEKRQKVADLYNDAAGKMHGVKIPFVAPNVKMSWFVYVIRLDQKSFSRADRDGILQELKRKGIDCRDYFPPIHLEPLYVEMFGYKPGAFPVSEMVSGLTIAVPFYNNLSKKQIEHICASLEDSISFLRDSGLK